MQEKILLKRKFLLGTTPKLETKEESLYLSAKLLNQFGILVDEPSLISSKHLRIISELYGVNIPSGFYSNPQDTKYYTTKELLIEQLISYWKIDLNGVNSECSDTFDRVEIFNKVTPDYKLGKEIVLRNYHVITSISERDKILNDISNDLGSYTRKWSENEFYEFDWLFNNGYVLGTTTINSKDNNIEMFNKYPISFFAKSFDRKDVVKLSIEMVEEKPKFKYNKEQLNRLKVAVLNCNKSNPVSKKQAKYFNTIRKKVGMSLKIRKANNKDNPIRIATNLVERGYLVNAAKVLAKNGSLLTRNLSWLLSRADMREAIEILDLVKVTNPIVTMQFLQGLLAQEQGARTFNYFNGRKTTHYTETEYETKWRKSVLSVGMKNTVKKELLKKIDNYYVNLGGLGKVYIEDSFKKVAVPFNTSASGDGIDTLPTGSRVPIKGDYIRIFAYWKDLFDVDTALTFINKYGRTKKLYWGNYSNKEFGSSALTSGDDRSNNGAEFIDIKLSEVEKLEYKYAIFQLNGYGGSFNCGETHCGYQNKDNLDTEAWDSKNIEMEIKLPTGDSSEYVGFVVDIENREIVIVNEMQDSQSRVVGEDALKTVKRYLNEDYINQFNVYKIASLRGQVVTDPEQADIVFSNEYKDLKENQKLIRTTDIEKIVSLLG